MTDQSIAASSSARSFFPSPPSAVRGIASSTDENNINNTSHAPALPRRPSRRSRVKTKSVGGLLGSNRSIALWTNSRIGMQSGLTARNRFVDYVARNETPPSQSANKARLITLSNSTTPRRVVWRNGN